MDHRLELTVDGGSAGKVKLGLLRVLLLLLRLLLVCLLLLLVRCDKRDAAGTQDSRGDDVVAYERAHLGSMR